MRLIAMGCLMGVVRALLVYIKRRRPESSGGVASLALRLEIERFDRQWAAIVFVYRVMNYSPI